MTDQETIDIEGDSPEDRAYVKEGLNAQLKKGADILKKFETSIQGFDSYTKQFKALATEVSQLKRKFDSDKNEQNSTISSGKKAKVSEGTQSAESSGPSQQTTTSADMESGDEVDALFSSTDSESEASEDELTKIDQFFETVEVLGEPVSDKLANTVNNSLRGEPNKEKMKELLNKYKRPANITALQVPRIEGALWKQLTTAVKTGDANQQKTIGLLNQSLSPIVTAMDELLKSKNLDRKKLIEIIGDAFRLTAGNICMINKERKIAVLGDMDGQFQEICKNAKTSDTLLMGEDFKDKIKTIDGTKDVKMTRKAKTETASFLGNSWKGGKARDRPSNTSVRPPMKGPIRPQNLHLPKTRGTPIQSRMNNYRYRGSNKKFGGYKGNSKAYNHH